MKRLLVFTENYAHGGGNRYLVDLVNGSGPFFDEVIIASNSRGIFEEDLARLKVKTKKIGVYFLSRPQVVKFFRDNLNLPYNFFVKLFSFFVASTLIPYNLFVFFRLIFVCKPSLVLCCNGGYPAAHSTLILACISRLFHIPSVLSIVSTPLPRKPLLFPFEWLVDFLVGRSVNIIIVNAKAIALSLEQLRGLPSRRMRVIYNGLESINSFEISPPSRLVSDNFVIGCIARMDKAKGVLFLIEAFEKLLIVYPYLKLVLVGSGDLSRYLETRVKEKGIDRSVDLCGHIEGEKKKAILKKFDIYVFPSLHEGFPYSILEAMQMGLPIVASKVGGIPEAVRADIDALLICPASSEAIVDAIITLIENPLLRCRLGENAQKRFDQFFELEVMNRQVEKLIFELDLD